MSLEFSKALKYDLLFSIQSKIMKRQPSVGKLSTLLITKYDDKHPTADYDVYTSFQEVVKHHPIGTVRDFAHNYFRISNKLGETADTLHIISWTTADKPAVLIGGEAPDIELLKKVKGKFNLTINTTTKTIDIDLTGSASHTDMATKIQEAVKKNNNAADGFKDATCVWSTALRAFVLKSGAAGLSIMPLQTPSNGDDVSNKLGLSELEGARSIKKLSKIENIQNLLEKVSKVNGTYYVVTFDFEFDNISELDTLGTWVSSSNFDYLVLYTTTKQEVLKQYNYLEKFHKYTGLMVEYFPNRKPCGYTPALLSSLDFTKPDSNINIAYNEADMFNDLAITDEDEYNNLLKNKANSFATFGRTTTPHVWYQDGTIFGDISTANVYIGNSFIKFSLQQMFANFFNTATNVSSADNRSHMTLLGLVDIVMGNAKAAGLIPLNIKLTDDEKMQLNTIFGRNAKSAIETCEQNSYYAILENIDLKQRCANIKIAYIANIPLQKICVNNFIIRGN